MGIWSTSISCLVISNDTHHWLRYSIIYSTIPTVEYKLSRTKFGHHPSLYIFIYLNNLFIPVSRINEIPRVRIGLIDNSHFFITRLEFHLASSPIRPSIREAMNKRYTCSPYSVGVFLFDTYCTSILSVGMENMKNIKNGTVMGPFRLLFIHASFEW